MNPTGPSTLKLDARLKLVEKLLEKSGATLLKKVTDVTAANAKAAKDAMAKATMARLEPQYFMVYPHMLFCEVVSVPT